MSISLEFTAMTQQRINGLEIAFERFADEPQRHSFSLGHLDLTPIVRGRNGTV
jgi:hypothetical protein